MELLFRKYFWVINLAFLLLAAWMGAKTVNVFVAGKLEPLPDFSQPATSARASRPPPKPTLQAEALSKLTGIELPKEPEVVEATQAAPPQDLSKQEAVKTSLRVRLVGTMVANRAEWSMANIEDLASNETAVYMLSDLLQGAEVIGIERLRVIINNNGRKEYIDDEPGTGDKPVADAGPKPPAVAANAAPPAGDGIKAISDDNYEIPKDELNKAMGNLNDIAMQARIVPAFKDGQSTGFKLFSIRPNSLYSKIGIQNGDVIKRINGFEINSPDKALEIYSKLKDSSRIEIELERGGSSVRKTYNVRP